MNRYQPESTRVLDRQLERVIEPLASYISATSRPRAALLSAIAVLGRVVDETNSAASAHVATFREAHPHPIRRPATQLRSAL